jgi:hypothetical protein
VPRSSACACDAQLNRSGAGVLTDPRMAARIGLDEWTLAIVHLAAFVGTGIAWLAMNSPHVFLRYPTVGIPRGAFLSTFVSVLWASWPFLASFHVSRTHLPGRRFASWTFVGILVVSTLVGGYFLNLSLKSATPRQSELIVTMLEALLLILAAKRLSTWGAWRAAP